MKQSTNLQERLFQYDYYRMTGEDSFRKAALLFATRQGIRWAYYFRKLQEGRRWAKICLFLISRKYGIEVSESAEIGKGIYLGHSYNITIGDGVIIGDNVNLHKGCTLGHIRTGTRSGSPRLGNCVFVGINAVIVGGVTIGDDVLIAPNAFVNFDVPSHSVVIGNPGIIYHKENATIDVITYRV